MLYKNLKYSKIKLSLVIFLPIQIYFNSWFANETERVEKYYINLVFKPLTRILRQITSNFKFSIGLFLIYLIILVCIYYFFKKIVHFFSKKTSLKSPLIDIISSISIIYFIYMITWGLAYSRKSIVKINYLNTENIKFEEIINLTEYLVNKANQTRKLLKNSECRSEKIIPFFSEATRVII